ncbi:MAG TPA: DUF692 domain-containing protein [Candidatus Thermoplasmatota archaeon]|nr:DUF692 domain-containing protein [Candidatus Thermoplasmatota archaeon]
MVERLSRAVGIGYRPAAHAETLRHVRELDFLEVIADSFFRDPRGVEALASLTPVVPHALGLSLGSAVEPDYLHRLARVVEAADPPWHSDHVAFTRADGVSTGHLAPLPRTREALDVLVRNVRLVQAAIPRPLALENITAPFEWPSDEMEEPEFLAELTRRTGCFLLLDLENLRVNAVNHARDARKDLERLPLERVLQVHVAGGEHRAGVEQDTHSQPVSAQTWALLEHLCALVEPPAVLIERDENLLPFEDVLADVRQARAIVGRAA